MCLTHPGEETGVPSVNGLGGLSHPTAALGSQYRHRRYQQCSPKAGRAGGAAWEIPGTQSRPAPSSTDAS